MNQEVQTIEPGQIVSLAVPIKAFNKNGAGYVIDHGQHVLILEVEEYDITVYSHGEVLFCAPDTEFGDVT